MSAIILDGEVKSALATVRSLGRHALPIVCGSIRKTGLACHSTHVVRRFVYTSPKVNQEKFILELIKEAEALFKKDGQKPVLYCFSDATALTVARNFQLLQTYIEMPLPRLEAVEIAADKEKTYELAKELSIPIITLYKESEFGQVQYPCVIKNRHSIVWREGRSFFGTASFVFSHDELITSYHHLKNETGEAPLVQEFVQGDEYGVEMLCDTGKVIASFSHKRIRSLSPRGGAAVVKETALQTKEVELMQKYAAALVNELSWHGPIMIEFKFDRNTGAVKLMEINGRFWGSLPLAVKAGVDFPMEYYKLAKHEETQSPISIELGFMRTRHFLGDCKWVLNVFFKKDSLRKLMYPSRSRAFTDFVLEPLRSKGDIFDIHDLLPSWFEYIDILKKWQQR